jgi:hypothetical protein
MALLIAAWPLYGRNPKNRTEKMLALSLPPSCSSLVVFFLVHSPQRKESKALNRKNGLNLPDVYAICITRGRMRLDLG